MNKSPDEPMVRSEPLLPENRKGLIIVHTGPGKGKTTAALGTALRAVGQGLKVLMVQFIKGSWHYGELDAAALLGDERLKIAPMGRGFVKVGAEKPDPEDVRMAEQAWQYAREEILGGRYDMVILDEINTDDRAIGSSVHRFIEILSDLLMFRQEWQGYDLMVR
jgi:cob(I)alamin adenosyltransferase